MKFHYLIYKNLLLASVFSHMNPDYIYPFSTLLRFILILFYSLRAYLPRDLFPRVMEPIALPSHTCHMLCQSYYPDFIYGQYNATEICILFKIVI